MRRKPNAAKAKKRFRCTTCGHSVPMKQAQKHIEKRCVPKKNWSETQ